jgi:hypothetical protein
LMLLCMLLGCCSNLCNSSIPCGHTANISSTYVHKQDGIATVCVIRMRRQFDRLVCVVTCLCGTINGVLDWRFYLLTTLAHN